MNGSKYIISLHPSICEFHTNFCNFLLQFGLLPAIALVCFGCVNIYYNSVGKLPQDYEHAIGKPHEVYYFHFTHKTHL